MPQTDPLARVKRAAAAKRRHDSQYVAALCAARASGASFAQLAAAAGSTRQNVRQIIGRKSGDTGGQKPAATS